MYYKLSCRLISTFIVGLMLTQPIMGFAQTLPVLVQPNNDELLSTLTPKLEWTYTSGCYLSGSCYRVDIDDSEDFSSINKYTYTNNTYYSPQNLSLGKWYWRVKAKDPSGNWLMSNTYSFALVDSPTPTTTPLPTATPTPTLIPTNTPTPSQSKQQTVFQISNIPDAIEYDQSVNIHVVVTGLQPNSTYYLKPAFVKHGSTNYFGKTLVSDQWVVNNKSYSLQLLISTDSLGDWNGDIHVGVDAEDSGFTGEGAYIFKVGRYNSSGSGPIWSNEKNITIKYSPTSTPKIEEQTVLAESTTSLPKITSAPTNNTPPSDTITQISIAPTLPKSLTNISPKDTQSITPLPITDNPPNRNFFSIIGFFMVTSSFALLAYLKKKH